MNVLKVKATAAFEGEADATVTASDGQTEASVTFKVSTQIVGISGNGAEEAVNCYPNPFTDLLHMDLDLPSGYSGPVMIRVYNMAGVNILTRSTDHLVGGKGSAKLNMSGNPRGHYLLQVEAGGEKHTIILNKK